MWRCRVVQSEGRAGKLIIPHACFHVLHSQVSYSHWTVRHLREKARCHCMQSRDWFSWFKVMEIARTLNSLSGALCKGNFAALGAMRLLSQPR